MPPTRSAPAGRRASPTPPPLPPPADDIEVALPSSTDGNAIAGPSTSASTSSAAQPAKRRKTTTTALKVEETDGGGDGMAKKRKLKSCDSCKLRRVLCLPQPPPQSCPRCLEKGIACTTTPTIRKRPTNRTGKRIEEAKATFGTADANAPNFTTPSNAPWLQPRIQQRILGNLPGTTSPHVSSSDIETRLGLNEISGVLAAHLIELYQSLPQSWLPLFPRGRLSVQFEAAGRRLDQLPPQAEVLAHTIIALTCRVSSHPLLFGPPDPDAAPIPPFESLTPDYLASPVDLREFGRRREVVCNVLQQKAVRFAWERGTLAECSEENMACCSLLEMMEGRNNPSRGKPYGSAYVSHLRTLLDDTSSGSPRVLNISLGWSALIMREALYAANAGRTSHFTAADDLLLCGPVPPSIEEALLQTVDDVDIRDSITLFFRPMRPYTYHAARLARECSDKITGTYSRRQPLDERFVSKFLTQLDHLFQLLTILHGRIDFVLSAAASLAHALPAPFETERHYIMKACIYTLQLAWASLSLPVYYDLRRRLKDLETGSAGSISERRRTRERLDLLFKQVQRSTLKGARMGASAVRNAPSLSFLAELHQERLESWVEILLDAVPEEDGGEGITRAEKASDLQWMCDGYKAMGWAWSDHDPIINTLERGVEQLSLASTSSNGSSQATPSIDQSTSTPFAPPPPSSTTFSSNPIFDPSSFSSLFPINPSSFPPGLEGLGAAAAAAAGVGGPSGGDLGAFFSSMQTQLNASNGSSGIMPFDLDSLLSIPLFGNAASGTAGASGGAAGGTSMQDLMGGAAGFGDPSLFAGLFGAGGMTPPLSAGSPAPVPSKREGGDLTPPTAGQGSAVAEDDWMNV